MHSNIENSLVILSCDVVGHGRGKLTFCYVNISNLNEGKDGRVLKLKK